MSQWIAAKNKFKRHEYGLYEGHKIFKNSKETKFLLYIEYTIKRYRENQNSLNILFPTIKGDLLTSVASDRKIQNTENNDNGKRMTDTSK